MIYGDKYAFSSPLLFSRSLASLRCRGKESTKKVVEFPHFIFEPLSLALARRWPVRRRQRRPRLPHHAADGVRQPQVEPVRRDHHDAHGTPAGKREEEAPKATCTVCITNAVLIPFAEPKRQPGRRRRRHHGLRRERRDAGWAGRRGRRKRGKQRRRFQQRQWGFRLNSPSQIKSSVDI